MRYELGYAAARSARLAMSCLGLLLVTACFGEPVEWGIDPTKLLVFDRNEVRL